MLRVLRQGLGDGVVTTRYPAEPSNVPPRFRGAPEPQPSRPFTALPPASVCPSGAIVSAGAEWTIDVARCIFCGRCAGEALRLGRSFELSARGRAPLVVRAEPDVAGRVAETPASRGDEVGARVARRVHAVLGRSLHLRHLDAGSCNACDWELVALLAPHYDARRLGIDFVASPRHADGVIVTGPVTRNLDPAVRRTFEAVPEPRLVIAVGACACAGGLAGSSYASAGGVDAVLPVDVYVPGCPPRPEAILFGVLLAMGRVEATSRSWP